MYVERVKATIFWSMLNCNNVFSSLRPI